MATLKGFACSNVVIYIIDFLSKQVVMGFDMKCSKFDKSLKHLKTHIGMAFVDS